MDHLKLFRSFLLTLTIVAASPGLPSGRAIDVGVAGRSNAYPSIAAIDQFVAITWGATAKGGATGVYSAISRDGGRTFAAPIAVSRADSPASLSGEQPPRVSLVPRRGHEPAVVVVWTSKTPEGTRLLSARSDDGGRSFGRQVLVPGSDGPGYRGWQATATDPSGRVLAIWLDHRAQPQQAVALRPAQLTPAQAAPAPPAHHQHGAGQMDDVARAQLSKLYFGPVNAATAARPLAGGVCYCCKTAIATAANGVIHAAWRHVYPGSMRDIAFTTSRDGGRTFSPPVRISQDDWELKGCPENGPAIAVDGSGRIHVVWPTLIKQGSKPALALFHSTSVDGRRFTPRQQIPTEGMPGHPQIALDSRGGVVVTWDEQASGSRRVALGRAIAGATGTLRFERQPIGNDNAATYPVIARVKDAVVTAWTSGPRGESAVRVERIPF